MMSNSKREEKSVELELNDMSPLNGLHYVCFL